MRAWRCTLRNRWRFNGGAQCCRRRKARPKLGLLIDSKTPGAAEALRACLKAYRDAQAPALVQGRRTKAVTLRDVYDRWKKVKKRSDDSLRACLRALELFEQQIGASPPVHQITRDQGDAFRAWLQQQGTSSRTASDRLTWVKSLLKYARRDLEIIERHPWEGLDIAHRTDNPRKNWTAAQLQAFFSLPLYTEHRLPTDPKAGFEAAYWVPLLGLYTGARVGQLCQLRTQDVVEDEGVHFLSGRARGRYENQNRGRRAHGPRA